MRRHGLTIEDMSKVVNKSYPPTHKKLTRKTTQNGKVALFDIEEANSIINFVMRTEGEYLKNKYGDNWKKEWDARWGHIRDWMKYLFFDEVVTNETTSVRAMGE
jgi:hypothetical protein